MEIFDWIGIWNLLLILKLQGMKKLVLILLYVSIHLSEMCKERYTRSESNLNFLNTFVIFFYLYSAQGVKWSKAGSASSILVSCSSSI